MSADSQACSREPRYGRDRRVAYLVLPALWALSFVLIIQWVDSSRDAALLLAEAAFCALVYLNVNRLGMTAALHLVLASLCVYQSLILELNRDITHIGSIWFVVLPVYAAVFGDRGHIMIWAPTSLLCVLFAALRASPDDLLWQHPLTLPNLIGSLLIISACSVVMLRDRQQREASLERALASVQEAERSKARLLSVLSHELRAPLTAVAGAAELLADSKLTGVQQARLSALRQGAQSMTDVLGSVLNLSRLESGHHQPGRESFDLPMTVESQLQTLQSDARARGCRILLDLAPTMPVHWQGDAGCLTQVLVNLVGNAVRHSPGGWVRVAFDARDGDGRDSLHLRVEDTGSGIAADRLERIFEPFVQAAPIGAPGDASADHDVSVGAGVGLGLAIVARIVELLDGRVSVTSEPDVGTVFDVELPFSATADERLYASRVRPPAAMADVRNDVGHPSWFDDWVERWQRHWWQADDGKRTDAVLRLSSLVDSELGQALVTASGLSVWLTDSVELNGSGGSS